MKEIRLKYINKCLNVFNVYLYIVWVIYYWFGYLEVDKCIILMKKMYFYFDICVIIIN